MLEWITQINNAVNGVVWGPAGLALLFGTGLIMSVRTGFFQFRKMGYWLRHTIGAIFTNKDVTAHTSKEDMAVSQFKSVCTALAGTIGTRLRSGKRGGNRRARQSLQADCVFAVVCFFDTIL